MDGNKRVGFVLLELFLALNGYDLEATDTECVDAIVELTAERFSDADFTAWVQRHLHARARRG